MSCDIDKKPVGEIMQAINVNCNCQKRSSCQLDKRYKGCKENATTLCRSSVSNVAALFISSPNIDECKEVDKSYITWEPMWKSCAGEYSFNTVSYRIEIIIFFTITIY